MPARLAFCNDADFADWSTCQEVRRILTDEVGLPAEDSFWLFDPSGGELGLWKSSLEEKGPRHDELLAAVASGHLTVLHGAGNFSKTATSVRPRRALIAAALEHLASRARVPAVWTNHGDEGDVANVGGAAPTYQQGDDPGSDAYVLDLLLQHGVRYFWTDRHATNDFSLANPLVTERTRSGHEIRCFWRYRGALPKAPDAQTLAAQLSPANLEALVASGGSCVIYQHWAVHRDASGRAFTARRPVFPKESLDALRAVAKLRDAGALRVLKVSELLDEHAAARAA